MKANTLSPEDALTQALPSFFLTRITKSHPSHISQQYKGLPKEYYRKGIPLYVANPGATSPMRCIAIGTDPVYAQNSKSMARNQSNQYQVQVKYLSGYSPGSVSTINLARIRIDAPLLHRIQCDQEWDLFLIDHTLPLSQLIAEHEAAVTLLYS